MSKDETVQYLEAWTDLWRLTDVTYASLLKQWDLSLNAYFLLVLLYKNPEGIEPSIIADEIGIMRQMVTIILNDLETRKLIRRKESKIDHRRKKITLTVAGIKFCKKVMTEICDIEAEGLVDMTTEEQQTLLDLSVKYFKVFKKIVEKRQKENDPKIETGAVEKKPKLTLSKKLDLCMK